MREITTHHDGHGLNEDILVGTLDEPGPGGACHEYVLVTGPNTTGYLQFQKGPRDEYGSTPGVTEGAILAILIDRLESFQAGPYACEENAQTLYYLREALAWTKNRAHDRAARGVLGKSAL